jgi:hypothetical protein
LDKEKQNGEQKVGNNNLLLQLKILKAKKLSIDLESVMRPSSCSGRDFRNIVEVASSSQPGTYRPSSS